MLKMSLFDIENVVKLEHWEQCAALDDQIIFLLEDILIKEDV